MEKSETPNTHDCHYGGRKMKVGWCFAPPQKVACPCKADKESCQDSRWKQGSRQGGAVEVETEGDARGLRKESLPRLPKILLHPLM